MSQSDRPIVGSVFERKTSAFSAVKHPTLSGSSRTGFPTVQHRSKSAFAHGRDELKRNASTGITRAKNIPVVQPVSNGSGRNGGPFRKHTIDPDDLRRQISEENEKMVEGMTKEERDQERREIIEQFGMDVGDILQRARAAREKASAADKTDTIQMIDVDANSEQANSDTSSERMSSTSLVIF